MISNMDTEKISKRGGRRQNAGKKPDVPGTTKESTSISVSNMTLRKLAVLGDKNISKGVEIAADIAYDRYQRI